MSHEDFKEFIDLILNDEELRTNVKIDEAELKQLKQYSEKIAKSSKDPKKLNVESYPSLSHDDKEVAFEISPASIEKKMHVIGAWQQYQSLLKRFASNLEKAVNNEINSERKRDRYDFKIEPYIKFLCAANPSQSLKLYRIADAKQKQMICCLFDFYLPSSDWLKSKEITFHETKQHTEIHGQLFRTLGKMLKNKTYLKSLGLSLKKNFALVDEESFLTELTADVVPNSLSLYRKLAKINVSNLEKVIPKIYSLDKHSKIKVISEEFFIKIQAERIFIENSNWVVQQSVPEKLKATFMSKLYDTLSKTGRLQSAAVEETWKNFKIDLIPGVNIERKRDVKKNPAEKKEKEKCEPSLGSTLVQQLISKDDDVKIKGLNSLISIVKLLDLKKQKDFVLQFSKFKFITSKLIDFIELLYGAYVVDEKQAGEIRQKLCHEREELYKDIRDLKHKLMNKVGTKEYEEIEKIIEDCADEIHALAKKANKELDELYDKQQKAIFVIRLTECYSKILKNVKNIDFSSVRWNKIIEEVCKSPAGYPGDLFNAPLPMLATKEPTKLDIGRVFANSPGMENCLFAFPKSGGANDPGEFGGNYLRCYQTPDGTIHPQIVFFKQATDDGLPNHRENIAEVMGGYIMNQIVGDTAASTYFSLKPGGKPFVSDDCYVAVIFFDGYIDLHTAAHRKDDPDKPVPLRGKGSKGAQEINSTERETKGFGLFKKINIGGTPRFRPGLIKLLAEDKINVASLGSALGASVFVGNHQIHTENVGLAIISGIRQCVVIDFGGAFRRPFTSLGSILTGEKTKDARFERSVHPFSINGKKYKACYFLAYPPEILESKDFIEGIDVICQYSRSKLKQDIHHAVDYALQFYDRKDFINHFVAELDTGHSLVNADEQKTIAATKDFLHDTLIARQLSMKEFSLELKLRNYYNKNHTSYFYLDKLILDNPCYFLNTKWNSDVAKELPQSFKDKTAERVKVIRDVSISPVQQEMIQMLQTTMIQTDPTENLSFVMQQHLANLELLEFSIPKTDTPHDQIQVFKNDLSVFMEYLRNSSKCYSFIDSDDRAIIIQACDEVYRMLLHGCKLLENIDPKQKELFVARLLGEKTLGLPRFMSARSGSSLPSSTRI